MWNSMDNTNLYCNEEQKKEYKFKNIKDWDGEDCLEWAADVEHELSIPLTSWVSIDSFQRVTGRDLLRYNDRDFRRLVDDNYGPKFFKNFRMLLHKRKEAKACSKYTRGATTMDTLVIPQIGMWTVPQSCPIQLPNDSSYYNASPSFNFLEEDGWNNYRTLASPCSPTPNIFLGQQRNLQMMSGGFISYGEPSGTLQHLNSFESSESSESQESMEYKCREDLNNSFENYGCEGGAEGATALLPDFNTLMIRESYKEQFLLEDIDLNFKQEDFSNLDQYLHGGEDLECELDSIDVLATNTMSSTQPSILVSDDFEDKMLKKITTGKRGNRVRHPQSWEFLVRLLMDPASNPSLIRWEDKENGVFRLVKKEEIARLWGKRSHKHKDEPLTYDNFARILRYHYKSKVLLPVSDKHLVYKLGDKVLTSLKAQGVL